MSKGLAIQDVVLQSEISQDEPPSPTQFIEMEDSVILENGRSHTTTTSSQAPITKVPTMARHTLGLLLLLCVVFLWTASNFLGSSVLADDSYAKPFFLTYVNTTLFIVLIIPTLFKTIHREYRAGTLRKTTRQLFSLRTLRAFWRKEQDGSTDEIDDDDETEAFLKPKHILPTSTSSGSHIQDQQQQSASLSERLKAQNHLGLIPTACLAFWFCMLWFLANYLAMACLQYTTVASTTILTATSSVWTLLIGSITGTEKFTWRKLCGVLGSICGVILISHVDLSTSSSKTPGPSSSSPSTTEIDGQSAKLVTRFVIHTIERALDAFPSKSIGELALGDALALLSAIIYGFYTIALKSCTLSAAPLEIHMPTFFGLVGICNIILLMPLFPILHFTGIETFQWPPTAHIWGILIINSLSSLLSDMAWAYAMIFTTPLLVTVALSLTIPLSLVGEVLVQGRSESWVYWIGAMVVVGSFVFVEREESKEEEDEVNKEVAVLKENDVDDGDGDDIDNRSQYQNRRISRGNNSIINDEEEGLISPSPSGHNRTTSFGSISESRKSGAGAGVAGSSHWNGLGESEDGSDDEDDRRRDEFYRRATGSVT